MHTPAYKTRLFAISIAFTYFFHKHVGALNIPRLSIRDDAVTSVAGFDLTGDGGVRAAAYAAPVWLFAREEINGHDPCYPEGATNAAGNGPNPGTDGKFGPAGPDPGDDCTHPGPAKGRYSPGKPFPNYISVAKCADSWRINYSLYYVHDGAGSQGHKHDWESATVVLKEDAPGTDMWHRDSLILTEHDGRKAKAWKDIESVNAPDDQDENTGQSKMHPKVFVSFFKHANFFDKKTAVEVYSAASQNDEYRSDDWYEMGDLGRGDFVLASTLDAYKDSYGGTTAPYWITHAKKAGDKTICDY